MSRPMELGLVGVAFAVSGILSELLMGTPLTKTFLGAAPTVLPFAILAAVLCTRPLALGVVTVCLHCAVWVGAYWLAIALDSRIPQLNMCLAGMAGGVGVGVAAMLGCPKLVRARAVLWLGVAGTIAAIPFQIPFFIQGPDSTMIWPFAIWQAAVGTLLYAQSER